MTPTPDRSALVRDRLGVVVRAADPESVLAPSDLFDLALRINPRRPHLLVSTVLGKHVPTDPRVVVAAGLLLGDLVAATLADTGPTPSYADGLAALGRVLRGEADAASLAPFARPRPSDHEGVGPTGLVFGYAETATGLGHLVGRALAWPVLHSTRRRVPGFEPVLDFDEAHSHATEHLVTPEDPALLDTDGAVVLVDDELSTGSTALNTIRALHGRHRRARYLIACLVDVRTAADRDRTARTAAELGVRIDVVALAAGTVTVPEGASAAAVVLPDPPPEPPPRPARRPDWAGPHPAWPWRVRETGRHGFTPDDDAALTSAATAVARALDLPADPAADPDAHTGPVLVLGTEELIYAPLAIASALAAGGRDVRFSTTTRSPVRVVDAEQYPIRSVARFGASDVESEPGPRFAYNVAAEAWSGIVVVVDTPAAGEALAGLLSALEPYAPWVRAVVLPSAAGLPEGLTGPDFGSYAPDEVTWLLQDLSHVVLEAPTEQRERAIQAGEAHYAESLPVEYRPEPAYRDLFARQLPLAAPRVATAVGAVTDLALRERRRDDLVLVSLARAGTPVGVLMQRWARHRHGLEWPHYAISIVRDRGIDLAAMRYLATRHDPRRVLFVDGWTGKGAITLEFTRAVARVNADLGLGDHGFDPGLAVLADPGECVEIFGTRDDFLIPSACLNSTVSGLVSRTVLNPDLIGPHEFHGAKCYRELEPEDVSHTFLDAVSDRFGDVEGAVEETLADLLAADRGPTWVGWAATEQVREEFGIPHINLVKPGVGETTRVLLRRVPWLVVVNPDHLDDLAHVELLAAGRGVEVVPRPGLPYSCMGLIRPTEQDGS